MGQMNFKDTLIARVDGQTRAAIEEIAAGERRSMAEVTRELLSESLAARGLIAWSKTTFLAVPGPHKTAIAIEILFFLRGYHFQDQDQPFYSVPRAGPRRHG